MARIDKGILGGFTGKVGNVIGSSWHGISYIRSLPAAGRHHSTLAQQAQRLKFATAIRFVKSLRGLFLITYKNAGAHMTEMNSAVGQVLKSAITGTYPDFRISYPNVFISRGDLPNAAAPSVTAATNGSLDFTWTDNSGTGIAKSHDKAVLVAYEPQSNTAIYKEAAANRQTGAGSLELSLFRGKMVHTYLSFLSANGLEAANSIYTGEVVVG